MKHIVRQFAFAAVAALLIAGAAIGLTMPVAHAGSTSPILEIFGGGS